jgi:hypothetical protein
MQPLHVMLPEIEQAVERRVECKAVNDLDEGDLRQLVYAIVESYQRELGDPALYLERLVEQSDARRDEVEAATERSVSVREAVLRQLLEILGPAMPALLGPVPAETWNQSGQHEQRTDHPVLRGFELLDGMRKGPVGRGRFAITGRSWWIVALRPEDASTRCTARYAALEHTGEVDDHRGGQGHHCCEVRLVSVAEAALEIRDDVFDKVIAAAIRRLRAVASDQQKFFAERADKGASMLQNALRVLKEAK